MSALLLHHGPLHKVLLPLILWFIFIATGAGYALFRRPFIRWRTHRALLTLPEERIDLTVAAQVLAIGGGWGGIGTLYVTDRRIAIMCPRDPVSIPLELITSLTYTWGRVGFISVIQISSATKTVRVAVKYSKLLRDELAELINAREQNKDTAAFSRKTNAP
jgi:hypothetical protein